MKILQNLIWDSRSFIIACQRIDNPLNFLPRCITQQHNPEFAFLLRERSSTLQQMFTDAEELENNLWSCGKQLNYRGKDGQILRKQKRKRSK